jgi:hypothetical protein
MKRSIHEEDITIINIYTPNNKAQKFMQQKNLTKRKTQQQELENSIIHFQQWIKLDKDYQRNRKKIQ